MKEVLVSYAEFLPPGRAVWGQCMQSDKCTDCLADRGRIQSLNAPSRCKLRGWMSALCLDCKDASKDDSGQRTCSRI